MSPVQAAAIAARQDQLPGTHPI